MLTNIERWLDAGISRAEKKFDPALLLASPEQTFDELRARIQNVEAYLDTFQPADFQGAEDKLLVIPMLGQGNGIRGKN